MHACAADAVVTEQLLESKCNFALSVQQAAAKGAGGACNICPQTFVVPADLDPALLLRDDYTDADDADGVLTRLRRISKANPWVLKLDGSSCGLAVHVVTNPQQVATLLQREQESSASSADAAPLNWVCQKHISRPLLVRGGRKFHLRAFTLTVNGTTFFFEGALFARLCAEPWSNEDLHDPLKNLSNHTQAQKNLPGGAAAEVQVGLLATSDELPQLQAACPLLLERTRGLLRRAIRIGQVNDTTIGGSRSLPCQGNDSWTRFCLLAFDVMVNQDGRLFILEVNRGPGGIEQDTAGLSEKFRAGMRQMIRETIVLTAAENIQSSDRRDLAERFLSGKKVSGFVPLLSSGDGSCGDSGDATMLAIHRRSMRSGVAVQAEKLLWDHSGGLSGIVQQSFVESESEGEGEEDGDDDDGPVMKENGKSRATNSEDEGEDDEAAAAAEAREIKEELRARKRARGWRNNLLGFEDKQGRSALHLAVITGAGADVCQLFVDIGADVTKTMGVGGAPVLHYAVTTTPDLAVINILLSAGASSLTTYQEMSALELAAAAAAAAASALAPDPTSAEAEMNSTRDSEALINIAMALLVDAREKHERGIKSDLATINPAALSLVYSSSESASASASSDIAALLEIGKALNEKLAAAELEQTAVKEKTTAEATFLFDNSQSCEAWLAQGAKAMSEENFEEAASCFYQAMVGADSGGMAKAQGMLQTAVQAARSAKGLDMLVFSSSSEDDEDDY